MTKPSTFSDNVDKDFSSRNPVLPGVDPVIAQRYSTRAFQKHSLSNDTLNILFDAARQAPSCFNDQPWNFYCSSAASFEQFLKFLVPANEDWAKDSSAIVIITANSNFGHNNKPNPHGWFDAGAAWYSLAYQARTMGLYTHAMAGIEVDKIVQELSVPSDQEVVCAVAIGIIDEAAAAAEEISTRKPLNQILTIV